MRKRVFWGVAVVAFVASSPALADPTISQTAKHVCLGAPADTIRLSGPVGAGDDLVLVVSGQGYAAASAVVTGVSDPVNGQWSPLANDKALTTDSAHYLSYSVWRLENSKPASGGLTITINQVNGQSGASAVLLDVDGPIATDHLAFDQATKFSDSANGLFGAYTYGQSFNPGPAWNLQGSAPNCTLAFAESQVPSTSGSLAAEVNASGFSRFLSGLITFKQGTPPPPPSNTTAPSVSGTAQQGSVLTTTDGVWAGSPSSYSYAWEDCDASGGNCSKISGAASKTYTLQAGDVGHTLRSIVTAANSGGSASATSNPTSVVTAAPPPTPPVNTVLPKISGTPQQGQVLSASQGTWTGTAPISYSYSWSDGATGPSDTLTASDVGKTVTVTVTAKNTAGSASATSAPVGPVTAAPPPSGLPVAPMPVISHGLPAFGEGQVDYPPSQGNDGSYGHSYRCTPPCALDIDLSSVPGAQRQQALVAWYNHRSQFDAAATNGNVYYNNPRDYTIDVNAAPGGTSTPPSSGWTTLVTVTGNPFNGRQSIVKLNGANWIRMRVTAVNGSSGNQDAMFNLDVHDASKAADDSYLLIGDSITGDIGIAATPNFAQLVGRDRPGYFPSEIAASFGGATAATPLQTDPSTGQSYIDELLADYPSRFVSLDFGTNDAGLGGTYVSNFTANTRAMIQKIIAAGRTPIIRQSIPWGCTGNIQTNGPTINADLKSLLSQYSQAIPGPDFWSYFQQNQSDIGSDCIHPNDAGGAAYRRLYEQQMFSDGAYPPPPAPPTNSSRPTISGTPVQGNSLSADKGTWTGSPYLYSYRWQDCTSTCANIAGATGQNYVIGPSDVGKMIDVMVIAKNGGGSRSAKSAMVGPVTAATSPGVTVSGTKLLKNGSPVILHGIDRSGTEYACEQGWGIFDGPSGSDDNQEIDLIAKLKGANSVFYGLNEDCWLGINGVPAQFAAQNYIGAIKAAVARSEADGLTPVIGLFWGAPGSQLATGQGSMPDNDHSPAFWQQVANAFKGDPNVIFRLKEEPYPGNNSDSLAAWTCWSKGDMQYDASNTLKPVSQNANCSEGYPTVGMQSLINIIRGTGATNVIQVPGVQYANSMTHFLDQGIRVVDTLSTPQLTGDVDVYPDFNACGSTSCYDSTYAPVIAQMPFAAGETGVDSDIGCPATKEDAFLSWMDQHNAGYYGWVWDAWGGCGVLITNYNGTLTTWGNDFANHIAAAPTTAAAASAPQPRAPAAASTAPNPFGPLALVDGGVAG
jgi:endoglucanase